MSLTYKERVTLFTRGIVCKVPILTGCDCVLVHLAQPSCCPNLTRVLLQVGGRLVETIFSFPSNHFHLTMNYLMKQPHHIFVIGETCVLKVSVSIIYLNLKKNSMKYDLRINTASKRGACPMCYHKTVDHFYNNPFFFWNVTNMMSIK